MVNRLVVIFMRFKNVEVQFIILSFVQDFVAEINDQDKNTSHRFVIFRGEELTCESRLAEVLKMDEGSGGEGDSRFSGLEWVLGKE